MATSTKPQETGAILSSFFRKHTGNLRSHCTSRLEVYKVSTSPFFIRGLYSCFRISFNNASALFWRNLAKLEDQRSRRIVYPARREFINYSVPWKAV